MNNAITFERFEKFGFSIFKDQDSMDYDSTFSRHKKFLVKLEKQGVKSEGVFNLIKNRIL